jgi:hypothetical protein
VIARASWKRRLGIVTAAVAIVSTGLIVDAQADAPPLPDCGRADAPEERNHQHAEDGDQLQGDVPLTHRVEDADGHSRAEQGYNCGLALVGHTTLGFGEVDGKERNTSSNANMAWSQDCAYVSGPGSTFGPASYEGEADDLHGVAVVDVSNPRKPRHVRTLTGVPQPEDAGYSAANTKVSETLFAIDVAANGGRPERHVLVVGQYGNAGSGNDKPMNIYDVDDCTNPRLLETFTWPENIHNLTISGNGKYVFATQPLQMVDIDPLFDDDAGTMSDFVGNIEFDMPYPLVTVGPGADLDDQLPDQAEPVREANRRGYSAHQAWSTYDGTELYLGAQTPQYEVFTIVDIKNWLATRDPVERATTARPDVLSQRSGRGHSVSRATIAGAGTWVLHAEESVLTGQAFGCHYYAGSTFSPNYGLNPFAGAAEAFLSDVSDPRNPTMHVNRLRLEINQPENCLAQFDSKVQASVHYHEFDRETDARFAMLSMQNAGIRVFDVRHPGTDSVREVAYFNPGDVTNPADDPTTRDVNEAADGTTTLDYAWGHPRFVPKTGHIWFATRAGGFWVVELEPQVRDYFDMDGGAAPVHPAGAPGTTGVQLNAVLPAVDVDPAYCTLGRPI